MAQKILLTCDICGKQVEQRKKTNLVTNDPSGDPAVIGGMKGLSLDNGKYTLVDFDFCEEHWNKIIDYVKTMKELK
jgi:hypothetical protein